MDLSIIIMSIFLGIILVLGFMMVRNFRRATSSPVEEPGIAGGLLSYGVSLADKLKMMSWNTNKETPTEADDLRSKLQRKLEKSDEHNESDPSPLHPERK